MTDASYRELVAQREALDAQIKAARDSEIASVMATIQALVKEHDLTPEDIFPNFAGKPKGKKVEPKYRDPASGSTWTGRGKPPAWTKQVDLEQCRIRA